MHPVVVLIPLSALAFLPGLWARRLLQEHNTVDIENLPKGHELAREILDRYGLRRVRVECTDLGDHYDPKARAVRLARDKYDRRSLAAATAAAHEAAHALQDATDYAPFVWRTRLVSLARVTGQVGATVLIVVPAASLIARQAIPPVVLAAALFGMLGTGMAAQIAALPTELNASFRHALPMLKDEYLDAGQWQDARRILLATSSTYVAASLLSVLNIWPWVGTPRVGVPFVAGNVKRPKTRSRKKAAVAKPAVVHHVHQRGPIATTVRILGKPLIKGWLQLSRRVAVQP